MICSYCGAKLPENTTCQDLYSQVAFYTLNSTDPAYFIHQLVVDAYGAQHANEHTKPIGTAFALIGLYLFSEKGYTGKQVQLAHMELGKVKRDYPKFLLPKFRGKITAADVLNIKPGPDRDNMIKKWAKETWQAFIENRPIIINFLNKVNFKDLK